MAAKNKPVNFRSIEELEGYILHYAGATNDPYPERRQRVSRWRYVFKERRKGTTLQAIADHYGVTRERVRQIQNDLRARLDKFYAGHTM